MTVEVPTTVGQIEHEIEAGGGPAHYLSNLLLKLPFAESPVIPGEPPIKPSPYRLLLARAGGLDIPFNKIVKETGGSRKGYSKRLLGQTPRQFFAALDGATDQLGLLETIIAAKPLKSRSISVLKSPPLIQKFVPLYVGLRQMGYSPRDLTS